MTLSDCDQRMFFMNRLHRLVIKTAGQTPLVPSQSLSGTSSEDPLL